ncbi:MAG TPA: proteasome-activating nucleotidase [Candidatus Thermoplasmatota archaeon]|nr:proteasome-activating nucleotidase [Candidatus Thermoplasmatota archaeon]
MPGLTEAALREAREVRLQELEARNAELRDEKRKANAEVKHLREEVRSLTKEVQRLTIELEKIKHPPLIVGSVLDILVDGRVVIKSSTGPNFVVPVADFVDRAQLSAGTRVSLSQNNLTVVGILPSSKDPLVGGAEVTKKPSVTYADIGGLEDVLQQVRETVEYPLTKPHIYQKLGVKPPKGVLLRGPPGTGKTMLAKAVANATDATFIRLVASELVQKFIGEGARRVHEVFQLAREKTPAIIFIDEIDALGARRTDDGTTSNREVERTLMQLLSELDGFEPRGDVRIIAATNRADTLDPALLRPGRFDRIIDVPLPTPEAVKDIFRLHTRGMAVGPDVQLGAIVDRIGPVSGAEVQAICMEAGMRAVRQEREHIVHADFLHAIQKYDKGASPAFTKAGGAELYA